LGISQLPMLSVLDSVDHPFISMMLKHLPNSRSISTESSFKAARPTTAAALAQRVRSQPQR
jgi:hypothetical protein